MRSQFHQLETEICSKFIDLHEFCITRPRRLKGKSLSNRQALLLVTSETNPLQQDRRPCSTNRVNLWFMAVMHELISVTLIRFPFPILMVCILRSWIFLEKNVATDAKLPGKFYDFIECKFLGWKCIHHGNLFGCPLYKALLPEGGLSGIG